MTFNETGNKFSGSNCQMWDVHRKLCFHLSVKRHLTISWVILLRVRALSAYLHIYYANELWVSGFVFAHFIIFIRTELFYKYWKFIVAINVRTNYKKKKKSHLRAFGLNPFYRAFFWSFHDLNLFCTYEEICFTMNVD